MVQKWLCYTYFYGRNVSFRGHEKWNIRVMFFKVEKYGKVSFFKSGGGKSSGFYATVVRAK